MISYFKRSSELIKQRSLTLLLDKQKSHPLMKELKAKIRLRIMTTSLFLLLFTFCQSQELNKSYLEFGSFINTIGLPFKAGNEAIQLNRPLGIRLSYGQHLEVQEDWYSNYEIAATFYRQRHLNTSYQLEGCKCIR